MKEPSGRCVAHRAGGLEEGAAGEAAPAVGGVV